MAPLSGMSTFPRLVVSLSVHFARYMGNCEPYLISNAPVPYSFDIISPMTWATSLIIGIPHERRQVTANFNFFAFFGVKETLIVMELRMKPRYTIICVGINTDFWG